MVSKLRWKKAQVYEQAFWENMAKRLSIGAANQLEWYRGRAQEVLAMIKPYITFDPELEVLEIGSGPIGIVNYLDCKYRYALDPLESYYRSDTALIQLRDKQVTYIEGKGEDVTSLNTTFSLIILDNVLDHVENPDKVLYEIHKNLKKGGILFFSINIYTGTGVAIRRLIELFEIDKGHPYSFSEESITSFLKKHNFSVMCKKTEDYREQKRRYRLSKNRKNFLKSWLCLTDYRYTSICKKLY